MKKLIHLNLILFFIAFSFNSCTDETSDSKESQNENNLVNEWIYDIMINDYYWYNTIDNHTVPDSEYPEDYFYSLVYDEEDKWSYISDDFWGLMGDLMGTPVSMGYSPAFGQITGTNNVFMVIEYVYPDSPADRAGLKRGDLILEINDIQLNINNFVDLYNSKNQKIKLAYISEGEIYPGNTTFSMSAEQLDINPALYKTLFVENGVNVGYLVITEFIDHKKFIHDVGESLIDLKNSGARELIIDLRYNGGGYITSAQWLASAIAPTAVVSNESLLTKLNYNDKIELTTKPEDKSYMMVENGVNFDLNKVVFLTAHGTASASELVIIGLDPYMEVIQVGDTTYGKYTGSMVYADMHIPPQHNWAMMPIIMKYANANGFSDFKNGLIPDYYMPDELLAGYPFGDINDPMLTKALEICTGSIVAKSSNLQVKSQVKYTNLFTRNQLNKMNLIIPSENN